MKKVGKKGSERTAEDDLRSEYQFDYVQARSNRFAKLLGRKPSVVMLDPDVAEVFTTSDEVNAVLRAIIETMPHRTSQAGENRSVE